MHNLRLTIAFWHTSQLCSSVDCVRPEVGGQLNGGLIITWDLSDCWIRQTEGEERELHRGRHRNRSALAQGYSHAHLIMLRIVCYNLSSFGDRHEQCISEGPVTGQVQRNSAWRHRHVRSVNKTATPRYPAPPGQQRAGGEWTPGCRPAGWESYITAHIRAFCYTRSGETISTAT